MTNYEKYKMLSEYLEYSYHGIKLSHPTACTIWGNANGKKVFTWRHILKIFVSYDVKGMVLPKENGFLATFMESYRKDHYGLFMSIIDRLSIKPSLNNLFSLKRTVSFHPLIIIKTGYAVLNQLRDTNLSLWLKLNWAVEYIYLCNCILELDKLDLSGVKKYLCMCHVLGFENLLTQYLRQKGVETFSLQEGIYLVYKKNIVLGSIAYDLFATDHLLCWGQYTKDEYAVYGIDPSRISVCGYPKESRIRPAKEKNGYRKVLVMLAGPIFGDVNIRLLEMLDQLKAEFDITLKSHPVNYSEMESYAREHSFNIVPFSHTIGECLDSGVYDFTIGVNTTAYYESWIAGVPSVRYYDERFDNFYGFDDLFSDRDEFEQLIKNYRERSKSPEEVRAMLQYSIGLGLDEYDKAING